MGKTTGISGSVLPISISSNAQSPSAVYAGELPLGLSGASWTEARPNRVIRSLLSNIDHIVIRVPVDELVVGVDAGKCRRLVDDDLERSVSLGEFLFLQI
jgi:hypothetical protein